ncbi:MAG TPA: hypothetical protein VFQ82_02105 [Stellaceae bacterium]|nr:hypothetical protein [Stellaceae bacterium]
MNGFSDPILYVVIAAFVLGFLVLIGMALLYVRSYPRIENDFIRIFRDLLFNHPFHPPNNQSYYYYVNRMATLCGETAADAMAKREVFWTLLIQSAVSLVVVVFIATLLLLKIVSAEAGLPILAAFGGAAISQGVNSGRAVSRARAEPPPPATEP